MRPTGIVIFAIVFLFLGHVQASGFPGWGNVGDSSYNKEYEAYTKAVRVKIGDNMSKHLDFAEAGIVSLNFEIASDGTLIQVIVNHDKTKASQKMIDVAIMSVKQSSPFGLFPEALAKNDKLPFSIDLRLKSSAQ